MAFNMSRWRVQSNNLYLPYADLDAAGSTGRLLTIPDDVGLTLAYPVLHTPLGFRTQKADIYGVVAQVGISGGYTQGYGLTQVVAGNATVQVNLPFVAILVLFWNTASTLRIISTLYETGLTQTIPLGAAAQSSNAVHTNNISIVNTTATSTTVTLTALQL